MSFKSDKKVVEDMWTALMDAQQSTPEALIYQLMNEEVILTHREAMAIVGELFSLRIAVDALKEEIFPGGKENPCR